MNTNSGYTMRKRAEQVEETRQRITEAAVKLHTSIGPAHTTISGVAEEADVTRVTVYRHFPDEEALFLACSSHWLSLHPWPDHDAWTHVEGLADRARLAFHDMYRYYRDNHEELLPLMRDLVVMPPGFRQTMQERAEEAVAALVTGSGVRGARRKRLGAVVGHALSFWTWRSLAIDGDLDDDEAVDILVTAVTSV